MTFAEKLRELREKTGITQAALATASGLSLGAIRDYEQGNKEPVLRSAFKLAGALGVAVEAFAACVEAAPSARPDAKPGRPRKASIDGEQPESSGEKSPSAKTKAAKKGKRK